MSNLNRIIVALAEKQKTGRWHDLGKFACAVSKWCSNSAQVGLKT